MPTLKKIELKKMRKLFDKDTKGEALMIKVTNTFLKELNDMNLGLYIIDSDKKVDEFQFMILSPVQFLKISAFFTTLTPNFVSNLEKSSSCEDTEKTEESEETKSVESIEDTKNESEYLEGNKNIKNLRVGGQFSNFLIQKFDIGVLNITEPKIEIFIDSQHYSRLERVINIEKEMREDENFMIPPKFKEE